MSTGSCLCSQVKYTFAGEPAMQATCHCKPCHKISGSAYTTNLVIAATEFKIISGSTLLETFSIPHESGMTLTIHFCTTCGSCVYKEGDSELFTGKVIVQAGKLDQGGIELGDFKAGAELWVKQRVPWLAGLERVAQLEEFPVPSPKL